jgi:hypothetical protein
MAPKNQHSRILLGKNAGGAIAYCEACDVVELEMGAISMRIDAASLEALSALFKDADVRLSYYRLEKARFEQVISEDLSFH